MKVIFAWFKPHLKFNTNILSVINKTLGMIQMNKIESDKLFSSFSNLRHSLYGYASLMCSFSILLHTKKVKLVPMDPILWLCWRLDFLFYYNYHKTPAHINSFLLGIFFLHFVCSLGSQKNVFFKEFY